MRNILAVVMVLSLVILPAFADLPDDFPFVETTDKYVTVFGYSYRFGSLAHSTSPGRIGYQSNAEVTNADTVPAGYMGIEARLYFADNTALCQYSGWGFNNSPIKGCLASGYIENASHDYYFSQGQVKFYNGDGYNRYDSYKTPYIMPMSLNNSSGGGFSVQTNKNGEIYGSELLLNQIGIEPDLILAENADGIVGYVRAVDLDCDVTCPEEAIAFMQSHNGSWFIPMYLSDGETVIGTFEVGNGTFEFKNI